MYMGGQYENNSDIHMYGSSCVAWDSIPDTPWASYCPPGYDVCGNDNWCSLLWCYVDAACPTAHQTGTFEGKELYFSYEACGVPDCYNDGAELAFTGQCPYDPDNTCGT